MNAYHNLAGWLRDVKAVLGDRTELADSYYWQLRDLLEEVLELVGDDEPDASGLEPEDDDADLELLRPSVSSRAGSDGGRARSGRTDGVGRAAGMASQVPRPLRADREGDTAGDAPAVARAGHAVKRVSTIEKPLPLNRPSVPRGTSGRSKKGGKRGTRKTKR